MSKKQKTAALYARYSSSLSNDNSIEDQFALCERVAVRNGLEVTHRFEDRAKTGRTQFGRDGLQDLKEAIDKREFDVLIVEDVDRMGRDTEDNAHIRKRLKWSNILLFNHSGEISDIEADIKGVISAQFIRDLTVKIKRGLDGKAEKGKRPGAITYGYHRVEVGVDAPYEAEANIVRRIFTEYANGKSPRDIAYDLTREGVPPPSAGKKNAGVRWSHQTLIGGTYGQGMLGNQLYIGVSVWNSHKTVLNPKTGKDTKQEVDASEHIVKQRPDLRIIDQNLWERVQARRTSRSTENRSKRGVRRTERSKHVLSGLLRCGACGGNMKIKGKDRDGHSRIVCANSYNYKACDNSKTYGIEGVKDEAVIILKELLADESNIELAVKEAQKHFETIAKSGTAKRAEINGKLTNVNVQIERIARTIIDVGDSPTMSKMLQEKEAERAGLQEQLKLATGTNLSLFPNVADVYLKNVRRFQALLNDGQDTADLRNAFNSHIEAVVIHPTGKRAGYDVEVLGVEAAWIGINLLPPTRSNEEIIEKEGFSVLLQRQDATCRIADKATQGNGVISLGRRQQAA